MAAIEHIRKAHSQVERAIAKLNAVKATRSRRRARLLRDSKRELACATSSLQDAAFRITKAKWLIGRW